MVTPPSTVASVIGAAESGCHEDRSEFISVPFTSARSDDIGSGPPPDLGTACWRTLRPDDTKVSPMTLRLSPGDTMPTILGKDADGNEVDIVASLAGDFAFVQLYRGHW